MIRKASVKDIDSIMTVIADGKEFLKSQGVDQWQGSEPSRETILSDIANEEFYVYELDGEILGVFMLTFRVDPTYTKIDGAWNYEGDDYSTIHRIATKKTKKKSGIAKELFTYALDKTREAGYGAARIDTHRDNEPMKNLIKKMGYSYCGVIQIKDGSDRNAYEIIL